MLNTRVAVPAAVISCHFPDAVRLPFRRAAVYWVLLLFAAWYCAPALAAALHYYVPFSLLQRGLCGAYAVCNIHYTFSCATGTFLRNRLPRWTWSLWRWTLFYSPFLIALCWDCCAILLLQRGLGRNDMVSHSLRAQVPVPAACLAVHIFPVLCWFVLTHAHAVPAWFQD